MKPKVYLDYAAATPLDPAVKVAMEPYQSDQFYNPSSLYGAAREARIALEWARGDVAQVLGAKSSEIVFTAGGTEAINLAIQGVARRFPGGHLVASGIEHPAVLATLSALERQGWRVSFVPVKSNGIIDPAAVEQTITDQTRLVGVALANHELGTIQPLAEIGRIVKNRRLSGHQIYLMSDASAAAGYLSLQFDRLSVDLMILNGAKIYGPKSSGVLYVRTGVELEPLIYGGGQQRGLRSGTENVAVAVGLAAALQLAEKLRSTEGERLGELRDRLESELQTTLPDLKFNGDRRHRLPNYLNLTSSGLDGQTLVHHLDAAGLAASTGAACSTADQQPSAVLLAIGLSTAEAQSSLRLTLGRPTTAAEVKLAAEIIPAAIVRLRKLATV